jgi:hypothetical protein
MREYEKSGRAFQSWTEAEPAQVECELRGRGGTPRSQVYDTVGRFTRPEPQVDMPRGTETGDRGKGGCDERRDERATEGEEEVETWEERET